MCSAYCTGLLLARRVLKKLEMDEEYEGNVEVSTSLLCSVFLYLSHHSMLIGCFLFRPPERIIQWNQLTPGDHSVLSLMLALSGLQRAIVSLVPLR